MGPNETGAPATPRWTFVSENVPPVGRPEQSTKLDTELARHVGAPRKTHVRDIILAQVDLCRAAGAFDQHEVTSRLQPFETFEHGRHQRWLHRGIISRA